MIFFVVVVNLCNQGSGVFIQITPFFELFVYKYVYYNISFPFLNNAHYLNNSNLIYTSESCNCLIVWKGQTTESSATHKNSIKPNC